MNPTEQTDGQLEAAITKKELELNDALGKALDAMDELRMLRQSPMSPEMARRGWSWDHGREEWHSIASTLVHLVRCNATEFGGGITREQSDLLRRISPQINC